MKPVKQLPGLTPRERMMLAIYRAIDADARASIDAALGASMGNREVEGRVLAQRDLVGGPKGTEHFMHFVIAKRNLNERAAAGGAR